jgi:hypothetical protein
VSLVNIRSQLRDAVGCGPTTTDMAAGIQAAALPQVEVATVAERPFFRAFHLQVSQVVLSQGPTGDRDCLVGFLEETSGIAAVLFR